MFQAVATEILEDRLQMNGMKAVRISESEDCKRTYAGLHVLLYAFRMLFCIVSLLQMYRPYQKFVDSMGSV